MSRIVISCLVLVICVYGSTAFTITMDDVVDVPEQGLSVVGKRHKRMSLGLSLSLEECAHVGSTCLVQRDKTEKPTQVVVVPCCKYLICVGIGPTELRNGLGQAHSSSDLQSSGICSLGLDNDQASQDNQEYVAYVKGL